MLSSVIKCFSDALKPKHPWYGTMFLTFFETTLKRMFSKKPAAPILFFLILLFSADVSAQSSLWGTTPLGFESGSGGIFSLSLDGKLKRSHHSFGENPGSRPQYCDLLHAKDGKFYGTATYGGPFDLGVIFQYDTAGNKYKAVHFFNGQNGGEPYGSLYQTKDGKCYGMTSKGGKYDHGVLYRFSPDSASFIVLHHFKDTSSGRSPYGDLIMAENKLFYGMTYSGGIYNKGVIFSYNVNKDSFAKIYDFNDTNGANPTGTLTQVGSRLYGVASQGGTNSKTGSIFSIDTATHKVSLYYSFGNSTGENPKGKLVMASNGRLYGIATNGGLTPGTMKGYSGTVFSIDTSKHNFSVIKQWSGYVTLANPVGSLLRLGNKLYGTCSYDGHSPNQGGVFTIIPTSTYNLETSFKYGEPSRVYSPLSNLSNGKLIGLSSGGGVHINRGMIYTFDTSSGKINNLLEFNTSYGGNNDNGSLMLASNGLLYGTTLEGGKEKLGVLYSINPKTSEKKILYQFLNTGDKGHSPKTKLIQSEDGKIWGLTIKGGYYDDGTIFSFDTGSNQINWEYEFKGGNDGSAPIGNLVFDESGILYGTTLQGGLNRTGTLFCYNPKTKTFAKLGDFQDTVSGNYPNGYLSYTTSGKILGLTGSGGKYGHGAVFVYNPTDSSLKIAASFFDTLSGIGPKGGLTYCYNGKYYGTTEYGGTYGSGTLFSYSDSSQTIKKVFNFKNDQTGRYPKGNLTQVHNGLLYGMCSYGGSNGVGMVFSFHPDSFYFNKIHDFDRYNGSFPSYGELTEVFTVKNGWTGEKDSLWRERKNWSNRKLPSEVPESYIPFNVSRFPFIDKHEQAGKIILDSAAKITIGQGSSLTVKSEFLNNGTLHVLHNGILLPGINYRQTGRGIYKVDKINFCSDSMDYSLWANPVNLAPGGNLPGKDKHKMKYPDPGASISGFTDLKTSDTLIPGYGYRASGDHIETISFSGIANNGKVHKQVFKDTGTKFFNLLGNPYPGPINAGKFLDLNSKTLDRVLYLKTFGTDSTGKSLDEILTINDICGSGQGIFNTDLQLNNADIGTATGFFAIALKNDSAIFDNSLRNKELPSYNTLTSSGTYQTLNLKLITKDSFYSQTVCAFSNSSTDGYNAGQDAPHLGTTAELSLFSLMDSLNMAIQSFAPVDSSKTIPLGMICKRSGEYTFELFSTLAKDYHRIYLDDKDSNKLYEFSKASVKVRMDSSRNIQKRFKLRIDRILPKVEVVRNNTCKGDTAVFRVQSPNPQFRYQWVFNGKAIPSDTLEAFKSLQSGKLVLRQTYSDSEYDETDAISVIVNELPQKPALKRKVAVIEAGTSYFKYQWFQDHTLIKDSISHSLTLLKPGKYSCMVTDTNTCINYSDTLTMEKVETEVIENNVCIGNKGGLKVKIPETGFKYVWEIDGKISSDNGLSLWVLQNADIRLIMHHQTGYRDTSITQKIFFRNTPLKPVLSSSTGKLNAGNTYFSYQWYRNEVPLKKDTLYELAYPQSGTYFCRVMNSEGCENYSDSAEIKRTLIKTILNNVCTGDTAGFEISEIKNGFHYNWVLNEKVNKTDTFNIFRTINGGDLVLIESNSFGYSDTSLPVAVTFRPLPEKPLIKLKDAKLNVDTVYHRYQWYGNSSKLLSDTNQFLNLADTGIYSCKVSNNEGCSITSADHAIHGVKIVENKNRVCFGDTATFEVPELKDGFRYKWVFNQKILNSDTSKRIHLPDSGEIRILEYNSFGYSDTSKPLNVLVYSLPSMPVISLEKAQLSVENGKFKYTWFRDGILLNGNDSQKCNVEFKGTYTCIVYNGQGCKSESAPFIVVPASIKEIKNKVCQGDSTVFKISSYKAGFKYEWVFKDTVRSTSSDSIFISQLPGKLKLRETNEYGYFEEKDSTELIVKLLPVAGKLTFSNGKLFAGENFDSYLWHKNGNEIMGNNKPECSPDGPGRYFVILNGCFRRSKEF
ncbi:MAG: hypothetical protein H6605_06600 [Flavobacteriales bacterium]|nr:hypothetical protein [Flavobacteriales bacterium]